MRLNSQEEILLTQGKVSMGSTSRRSNSILHGGGGVRKQSGVDIEQNGSLKKQLAGGGKVSHMNSLGKEQSSLKSQLSSGYVDTA